MKRTGLLAVIAVMFMAAMLAQSRQPAGTSHTGRAFRFNKVKDGIYPIQSPGIPPIAATRIYELLNGSAK